MKKHQPTPADTAGVTVLPQDRVRGPSPPEWEDNSGEGAASALESLRKREQSRRSTRPSDDRHGTQ